MTPAARLSATIDLLSDIASSQRTADAIIAGYLRENRKMTDDDRGAVLPQVDALMRHTARLGWLLDRHGRQDTARGRVLAWLVLGEGKSPDQITRLFSGATDAPDPLTPDEAALVKKLQGGTLTPAAMPEDIQLECPDWAASALRARFGPDFAAELAAMLPPAPVDLRVNTTKTTRDAVLSDMAGRGLPALPMPYAPDGLRVAESFALSRLPGLKSGEIEIQDEGSQLVARLVGAGPGDRVVDFCAGAGGKTLALAAQMNNKGRIIACDISEGRLKRGTERFRRAGVQNVQTKVLTSETDKWIKRHKASFDRVLIDAPCSGTGTWRRNPDARWRPPGEGGLDALMALQSRILNSAARLVKPGGRLVYATCSVLPAENEDRISAFLNAHPDFAVVPLPMVLPDVPSCHPDFLSLTPTQHQTDGFFAAVLERAAAAPAE